MGFFDRLLGGNNGSGPQQPAAAPSAEAAPAAAGGVMPRLREARLKLDAKDLPAAMSIYAEVLAASGDRADVLLTISGDLGATGHAREAIELVAPRYDRERHGPATGLNLLQAYIVSRQPEPAQHLLDLLFELRRPELEDRLLGFSNVIADLMAEIETAEPAGAKGPVQVSLVTISKPIWFYGLEEQAPGLFPAKEGRVRRVVFAQLAQPGLVEAMQLAKQPEDAAAQFARGFPLWLADTFAASAGYETLAAVGIAAPEHYAIFPIEWSADNIGQVADTANSRPDFVVTGALRSRNDDHELVLRVWEVKKSRELKKLMVRWSPATADAALTELHAQLCTYMEWQPMPAEVGLPYSAPKAPLAYVQALGAALTHFLGEKKMLPTAHLPADASALVRAAQANPEDVRAQLALVTSLRRRAGLALPEDAAAQVHAEAWLASAAARSLGLSG